MSPAEVLEYIKSTETAELDADSVAEIYALALTTIESSISEVDMRRLLLLGAAMYRNSTKGKGAELQLPVSNDEQSPHVLDDEQTKGLLH